MKEYLSGSLPLDAEPHTGGKRRVASDPIPPRYHKHCFRGSPFLHVASLEMVHHPPLQQPGSRVYME